jgi:hypothetical protein
MKTKTKHSAYKRQASRKPQAASNKRQATKQQAKEKKGGTRPQALTMVRGVMSHGQLVQNFLDPGP